MQNFTDLEFADIHYVYNCFGRSEAVVRKYRRRFPQRRLPEYNIFETTHRHLQEHGSFYGCRGQERPLKDYDIEKALQQIENNSQISIRQLS